MFYVCIENNAVVSVTDYRPNVPDTVTITQITDDDHKKVLNGTHLFSVPLNKVVEKSKASTSKDKVIAESIKNYDFLQQTDWMVLRHIRQRSLGMDTSLTEEEYIELEQQRHAASQLVKKPK
jgi:phage anti-repressor protein